MARTHAHRIKGVLSIEGANTLAWIEGKPLFGCMTRDESQIEYWRQNGQSIVFKIGETFAECRDGRFAIRYPATQWPNFSWCLKRVDEVEIQLPIGYCDRDAFLMPMADLSYNPEEYASFREWAFERYREWASKPTDHNGLSVLLARATETGWAIAGYTVPETNAFPASPKSQRDVACNYTVTLRKPGQQHVVMAPNFVSFKRSLQALMDSLWDLGMEE